MVILVTSFARVPLFPSTQPIMVLLPKGSSSLACPTRLDSPAARMMAVTGPFMASVRHGFCNPEYDTDGGRSGGLQCKYGVRRGMHRPACTLPSRD